MGGHQLLLVSLAGLGGGGEARVGTSEGQALGGGQLVMARSRLEWQLVVGDMSGAGHYTEPRLQHTQICVEVRFIV